jgi:beta-aspartyl-peptidase (threonine type)
MVCETSATVAYSTFVKSISTSIFCFLAIMFVAATPASAQESSKEAAGGKKIGFVIHGGAGTIDRSKMTPERERDYRAGLERAVIAGYAILKDGGSSLDAVETAVRILEDDPMFNAGKGAVFTSAGTNELDASIMNGRTLAAGAVSGVTRVKSPIHLARMVMEKSPHVMIAGEGAEAFATEMGIELVDPKYFFTQERWDALEKLKAQQKKENNPPVSDKDRHGTVGAVALDQAGNLAAATSTGGMTNKRVGRIGDAPIIGAGTYADNRTCAVSATGDGEYFIRVGVAREVSSAMEYGKAQLADAARRAIEKVGELGGTGGVIAIDKEGNIAMPFNTSGMYRAHIGADGKPVVEIYK